MIEKLSPEARTMLSDFLNQIDYEKDKEIERLNSRWEQLKIYVNGMWLDDKGEVRRLRDFIKILEEWSNEENK